jgi:hypothetical protein
MLCLNIMGRSVSKNRVTIVESEEDNFRSEFHRNRNGKRFKDTKWKRNYSEVARASVSDNNSQLQSIFMIAYRILNFCCMNLGT